ncbi:hypothetical protein BDN72DRAFT_963238 [Pluteus cervinus]|uniref:Uncharacterized protein n=1 Tax=Pluteus cervinus TaxID=181527 RepID=A0ACD3AFE9_9AGAR|nr:hypothetical protein BDN72DRAFT_963238 [Pluteus cervinus]
MDINTRPGNQLTPIPTTDPRFPPEIEYEIFLTAFYACKLLKSQTMLLRVAKRVSEWLVPLFYNVVIIRQHGIRSKLPPLATLKKYGHHIHHLFVMVTDSHGTLPFSHSDLLSSCPNVSNLALWSGTFPTINMLDLPIRKVALTSLSILRNLLERSDPKLVGWCSNITHIAMADSITEYDRRLLGYFPALRYLLVPDFDTGVQEALRRCPQLRVVILLQGHVSWEDDRTQVIQEDRNASRDIRVVRVDCLFRGDWTRGTKGLPDMWDLAEKEVERRRGAANA